MIQMTLFNFYHEASLEMAQSEMTVFTFGSRTVAIERVHRREDDACLLFSDGGDDAMFGLGLIKRFDNTGVRPYGSNPFHALLLR
jgi:hypothetical protein